jgi:toxin ParE1/3/4
VSAGRFIRTAVAEEDLIEIALYIAKDNPAAADRVLDALEEKTELLAEFPGLGAERPDVAAGVRAFPVGKYLILYREMEGGVEIVRYAHGARRLRGLV